MFILYLAFIPPERAAMFAKAVQTRLASRTARFSRPTVNVRNDVSVGRVVDSDRESHADTRPDDAGWPMAEKMSPDRISAALAAVSRDGTSSHDVARGHRFSEPPTERALRQEPALAGELSGDRSGRHSRHSRDSLK
jgi:hypothetical protein